MRGELWFGGAREEEHSGCKFILAQARASPASLEGVELLLRGLELLLLLAQQLERDRVLAARGAQP